MTRCVWEKSDSQVPNSDDCDLLRFDLATGGVDGFIAAGHNCNSADCQNEFITRSSLWMVGNDAVKLTGWYEVNFLLGLVEPMLTWGEWLSGPCSDRSVSLSASYGWPIYEMALNPLAPPPENVRLHPEGALVTLGKPYPKSSKAVSVHIATALGGEAVASVAGTVQTWSAIPGAVRLTTLDPAGVCHVVTLGLNAALVSDVPCSSEGACAGK